MLACTAERQSSFARALELEASITKEEEPLCTDSRAALRGSTQRRASDLQRRYPEMASRASFQSVIGQSYYADGNYDQAIRTLQPLQELEDYKHSADEALLRSVP